MKKAQRKNGNRLHLIALLLGAYGACLGFGLILAGLDRNFGPGSFGIRRGSIQSGAAG